MYDESPNSNVGRGYLKPRLSSCMQLCTMKSALVLRCMYAFDFGIASGPGPKDRKDRIS